MPEIRVQAVEGNGTLKAGEEELKVNFKLITRIDMTNAVWICVYKSIIETSYKGSTCAGTNSASVPDLSKSLRHAIMQSNPHSSVLTSCFSQKV